MGGFSFGHGDSGTTAVQSGARKFRVCVRIRRPRTFYLMVALQKHLPANSQLTGSPQNGVIDLVDNLGTGKLLDVGTRESVFFVRFIRYFI